MIGDKPAIQRQSSADLPRSQRNLPKAQETIYQFLLEVVKSWHSDEVLAEFKALFIHHVDTLSSSTLPHLFEIVFSNQEQEFRNTLKRSCYILINNWEITRNYKAIHQLVGLFADPILYKPTISPTLKRLRAWLRNFIESPEFQELKLFAARYDDREKTHWVERYTSYLLVQQYTNLNNPVEQRQAARILSRKLKDQFKFDLARYTALSQSAASTGKSPQNPTGLGDEVLHLIKRIVARRGFFSYPNLANIFLNQTKQLPYCDFKQSLLEYLLFSVENQAFAETLRKTLSERLDDLYIDRNDQQIDDALMLRTANRVIEYLTTETHDEPSPLFSLLLSRSSNPIALVLVFLKLILICPYARTHLEVHIAEMIRYYEKFSETDCQWVVNFFEIFNITMTIYTENVEYNLVTMHPPARSTARSNSQPTFLGHSAKPPIEAELEACRIFSQSKPVRFVGGKAIDSGVSEKSAS
jgi:hypothetical protein